MGYDSDMLVFFGIEIEIPNGDDSYVRRIARLVNPNAIAENGDVEWSSLDNEPHINNYYCLHPVDDGNKIYISCSLHIHDCGKGVESSKELILPSDTDKDAFRLWCINNEIVQKPTFLTVSSFSY